MPAFELPPGPCVVEASAEGLTRVAFVAPEDLPTAAQACPPGDSGPVGALLEETRRQLLAYFAGHLRRFELPFDFSGRTLFQRRVLEACCAIGYGEQMSYGELARRSGSPGAARAVGQVMATNQLVLVVPCHRVIGSNGGLTGYGLGLPLKQALLALEQGDKPWESGGIRAENRRLSDVVSSLT